MTLLLLLLLLFPHCLLFFPSELPSSYFAFKPMNSSGTAANLELEQLLSKKMSLFLKKPHLFQFNFESAETSENTRTKETDLSCRRLRKLNQLNEAKRFGLDVAAAAVVFIPGLEFCCTMFKRREGLQQHDGGRQRGFNFTASL